MEMKSNSKGEDSTKNVRNQCFCDTAKVLVIFSNTVVLQYRCCLYQYI